jgi:hypothetical protein
MVLPDTSAWALEMTMPPFWKSSIVELVTLMKLAPSAVLAT